jgi:hypothetical protein
MYQANLQQLQSLRSYPSVSILLPTHRTHPDNQQDPIRLRNLLGQANDRLLAEFPKREAEPVLARLQDLAERVDFPRTQDALALFASHEFADLLYLPYPVRERVQVDDTFATRDLVFSRNRSPRYWVLALSEQPTRLFEAVRDALTEVTTGGFPMTDTGPGAATRLPGGLGVNRSAYRDDADRRFFRAVDDNLASVLREDALPLALAGVTRNLAFFSEVSRHTDLIFATLEGSYDRTPAHELAQRIWPLAQDGFAARRQRALVDLEEAVGAHRYAAGMGECWHLAQEGRAETLLVEEDFHYPAHLDATGQHLIPADDAEAPGVLDDAVDDLIEAVLTKGGRVVFEEPGRLERYQKVALIARY